MRKRSFGAAGRFEAELVAVKIPRCPTCHLPGTHGKNDCPNCGTQMPITTGYQHVTAVKTGDKLISFGLVLVAIGAFFKRLHTNLSRRWNP